jgi:hypothetical protein
LWAVTLLILKEVFVRCPHTFRFVGYEGRNRLDLKGALLRQEVRLFLHSFEALIYGEA